MKKLFIIGGIIIVIFALIAILSTKSEEGKLKDNPYGTNNLEKSTINLIGNENYNNIILPEALSKKVESGEPVVAYFFSPECSYCMEMTPIMMPIAKEMSVDVKQYNMLEFKDAALKKYRIDQWPTLVYFKDGKEQFRMVGGHPAEDIRAFFNETKK